MAVTSEPEKAICRSIRPILDRHSCGAVIEESEEFLEVLRGLEFFLPSVLGEAHPFWRHESLDGILPAVARKTGRDEAEIIGQCILISDQTLTPIHVRLQVSPSGTQIVWLGCKLGESGAGAGGMVRTPYNAVSCVAKRLVAVVDRAGKIDWAYDVEFGEKQSAERQESTGR